MSKFDFAIVGGGILGLAHAYVLSKEGLRGIVIERGQKATGASIRNFGMIWPIGQPAGEMRLIALRSRELWLEVLRDSGIWHRECGSLHLAYHEDEVAVLEEFVSLGPELGYEVELRSPEQVHSISPNVKQEGLKSAMWSASELCVYPREVIPELTQFLETRGLEFRFGTCVTDASKGRLLLGDETISAERIFLCTGDDFETLFPDLMSRLGNVRCKLQMLKARPRLSSFQIGPHLCAGLTLGHYANFKVCDSLPALLARYAKELPFHVANGIHLLVSQHQTGELTIGDSHEYGLAPDPFLSEAIDEAILGYLDTFLPANEINIVERWHGVYARHRVMPYQVLEPCSGVTIVTGVGGAGMTLSFGLAEACVQGNLSQTKIS